jgi:hypothetical protein
MNDKRSPKEEALAASGGSVSPATSVSSYLWQVPQTYSPDCLVRVSDNSNSSINDVSNAPFSIVPVMTSAAENEGVPVNFSISQNYPNPFNPATQIRYGIPQQSKVQIRIFDLLGREVALLFDGEQPAGYHSITWKGEGSSGARSASGIYFYRIDATGRNGSSFTSMKKVMLLK